MKEPEVSIKVFSTHNPWLTFLQCYFNQLLLVLNIQPIVLYCCYIFSCVIQLRLITMVALTRNQVVCAIGLKLEPGHLE